jgi:hypothetical protein
MHKLLISLPLDLLRKTASDSPQGSEGETVLVA